MKRTVSSLLAFVLIFAVLPVSAFAAVPTEAEAYAAMIALETDYPEGTPYTNDDFYAWNGGQFYGGYGCAGFAFMLSDAAFGTLPARVYYEILPLQMSM